MEGCACGAAAALPLTRSTVLVCVDSDGGDGGATVVNLGAATAAASGAIVVQGVPRLVNAEKRLCHLAKKSEAKTVKHSRQIIATLGVSKDTLRM